MSILNFMKVETNNSCHKIVGDCFQPDICDRANIKNSNKIYNSYW